MFAVYLEPAPFHNLVDPGTDLPPQLLVTSSEQREYFDSIKGELRVVVQRLEKFQYVVQERLNSSRVLVIE